MANSFVQDIKDMAVGDLTDKLKESQEEYQQLTFDHATKGLDTPMKLRTLRRNIARIKTELRARELAELSPEELNKRDNIRKRRSRK